MNAVCANRTSDSSNAQIHACHLMTVVGNRPQFVKMAPLSKELAKRGYRECIVHTGQHFDSNMSDVFFEECGIPQPDVRLDIQGRSHGKMTAEILVALEDVMLARHPPWVLIYGDTNSTLAASLAAVKLKIPIAHVEAGPRIYDIDTPEEINRIVADHAARLRFCPDLPSVQHLARENITQGVYFTGDAMYDAFLAFSELATTRETILDRLGLRKERLALLTVHRPNNTDSAEVLQRLVMILEQSPLATVFPIHPRTENALKKHGLWTACQEIKHAHIIPAVGYLDILALINASEIVMTDSGGLQKEAFFAGKPTLVLFYATPWPQIQECGWQKCCWNDGGIDVTAILNSLEGFRPTGNRPNLFGDGQASKHMVDILEKHHWLQPPPLS